MPPSYGVPTNSSPATPIRNSTLNHFTAFDLPDSHVSPTKAAAQSRLNHEITTILTWLEELFAPNSVPPHFLKWQGEVLAASSGFDGGLIANDAVGFGSPLRGGNVVVDGKGEGVLETLKALKQVNLAADHLNELIQQARSEDLRNLEETYAMAKSQRDHGSIGRKLLDDVFSGLSMEGNKAFEGLCIGAVTLGVDSEQLLNDEDTRDLKTILASRIVEQSYWRQVLESQISELEKVQVAVSIGNDRSETNFQPLGDRIYREDEQNEQTHAQTAGFNRDTKQINLKIMEYEDRIKGLERLTSTSRNGSASFQDVADARTRVEQRKQRVKDLQQRFAAFNGLPADLEASRNEVRRAMNDLEGLKAKREGLFERIGRV